MTSVEKIHSEGKSSFSFPFKIYHLETPECEEPRVVISVPKRIFKRAVKRNLVRRRIREAWRLNRSEFPDSGSRHVLIIYTTSEILEYDRIAESVRTALGKIS